MPSLQAILVTSTLLLLLTSPQQSLALSNTGPLDHQVNRRHASHAALVNANNNRMIKKRQGGIPTTPIPGGTRPTSTSETPAQPSSTSTTQAAATPSTTATTAAATTTSASAGIIDNILSQSTTTTSATSSLANTASSTTSGTSATSASSQAQPSAPPTTVNQNPQITPPSDPNEPTTSGRKTPSTQTIVSNVTASATATSDSKQEEKPSQFGRNSIIAIAVIASCVGGAAAIWTLIRKWKLSPSTKFEDRMNPIEWRPDNLGPAGAAEKDAATGSAAPSVIGEKHQRAGSTGSRGSLRSSAPEQDAIGRNVTGNGNMFADQDPHQVVPPHDFTAGPATGAYDYNALAATGYVDLQRGNSTHLPGSGPALTRGPSVNHGYDYNYPPHDAAAYDPHAQYDYDNAHYATGPYAAPPADLQRGPSLHRGQDAYAPDAYGGYDASQYPLPNDPYAQYNQNAYGQPAYQQGRY